MLDMMHHVVKSSLHGVQIYDVGEVMLWSLAMSSDSGRSNVFMINNSYCGVL